jgi:serine/threonine protein phosphatase PrpC
MAYRWWSSCRTTEGLRRRHNEDAALEMDNLGLWVVADGMGGHQRGDVASRQVVEALTGLSAKSSLDSLAKAVRTRLNEANSRVFAMASTLGSNQVIGSTVVALLAARREALCLWAGDSRAYLLREGSLVQLTHDHSVVQQLVDKGDVAPEEARVHPTANRITRAVGAERRLQLDEYRFRLRDNDTVLLCSDGLTKEVQDAELAAILEGDCEQATQDLVELSLERGARDNVTVVVVRFEATTGTYTADDEDTAVNYSLRLSTPRPALNPA